MTIIEHMALPAWMPPASTVTPVAAGTDWDAVAVPQTPGLAVLAMLAAMPGTPSGPVIWATSNDRHPRLYFLVAPGCGLDLRGTPGRLLGAGSFVVVPGAGLIDPPGVYWLVPPHPDRPGELTDPAVLATLLRHVEAAVWVTYAGREVLVTTAQSVGAACLHCHSEQVPLHPGPTITTRLDVGVVRDTASALCTPCVANERRTE
ncbi:hypothetical protein [Kitasatospora sp. P5_F3]